MELTPIRIPGKRRKKGEPAPAKKAKRDVTRSQTMKKPKSKPKKPLGSYLERELPLEIIERIFWASETTNLAKASPRIGHMLSGLSTRRATFLNAFGPTWDVWFGCLKAGPGVKSYYGWQEDASRFGGSPGFQVSTNMAILHSPILFANHTKLVRSSGVLMGRRFFHHRMLGPLG